MGGFGSSLWGYILPFLFVLTIVVFFHELGHFMAARYCGIKVDVFSIGFGREIVGWNDRHGTRWKLSWIPLGGFVKFSGDENAASMADQASLDAIPESERKGLFHFAPLRHRAFVVAAGPFANFILAIVIFASIFTFVGRTIATPQIDKVQADSAAQEAGMMPGDIVTAIDGSEINTFEDMQRIVSVSGGTALTFTVERAGKLIDLTATPRQTEITDRFGNSHRVGIMGIVREAGEGNIKLVKSDPFTSVWLGARETWFVVDRTLSYLGGVISGKEKADQLGGPLRIAQVSGQVATLGFVALVNLAALLSVSIGLLNLFPVPLLDGGHLLYYGAEAVRGKPLGPQTQEIGFRVGLALVLMLMLFSTWNDLVHLQVFSFLSGLFS
ncbi:MAG: RIP metalloprotease RseP [Rhizobiales bacterium]|nr:RIP metalloprotease RseP [Hyphomicrobiales bacterium]